VVGEGDRAVGAGRPRVLLNDAMAAPNVVTIARLALVPVVVALLLSGHRAAAVAVLALSLAGDGLDGYLARRSGRVTELGKILDPIADKVAIDAVLGCLAAAREFPVWAFGVVLARDAAILAGAAFLARRAASAPQAAWVGKAALVALAAMTIAFAADARPLEVPLLWAGMALVAASGAWYALLFRRFVADRGVWAPGKRRHA
jgi:cardiolipin synthase (CMP-forming)